MLGAQDAAALIEDGCSIEIVAYGDDVYVYEPGDPSAEVVYHTAIGANLDAVRAVVTGEQWRERVFPAIADTAQVHDLRGRQGADSE
jgi:hypothetical protein